MITKLAIAAAAAASLAAGAAHAQEGDVVWTGPYVGLHAGATLNNSVVGTGGVLPANINNVNAGARPAAVVLERNGALGGAQVGYNQQFGRLVGGVEADFSLADANASQTYASPATFGAALAGTRSSVSEKLNYVGTVRGRLGYLVAPRLLLYGTGGYAYGDVKYRADFANSPGALQFSGAKQYDAAGWTAGAGVEYALPISFNLMGSHAVTVRAEYLHYDLGKKQVNVAAVPLVGNGAYVSNFKTIGDQVRAGVNFKF